jgi:hypothetical protein
MPTTTNFGWTTPADTDLVKDGAAAIRTLAGNIDTSLVDLKGGTTGQVLSKNSNTDLDYTWVAQDDSNAIQNAIIDAKGDLIVGTAADTPDRLAVGSNNQVLIADSAQATGIKWGAIPISAYAAWTPTFSNLTVGNGTLTGQYVQIGKMVHCYLKLAFGSTTSITGAVQITGLPVAPVSTNASIAAIVQALYSDASGPKFYGSSHASNNNTSRIWLSPLAISGSYIASAGDLSSTVPFTWTTSDEIFVSAIYEGV